MPRVIYYDDRRGREPVGRYLQSMLRQGERSAIATFRRRVEMLEEHGAALPRPFADIIDRRLRLFELRFGNFRAAYFEHDGDLVLLHAWRKRTKKLDQSEADVARSRLQDWRTRH
jgi:phage-related protein